MVVRLPEQALDTTGTDILPPLKELQQGLGVLPTDADRAKSGAGATFVGPPDSVAIIEAGATAFSKWWSAAIAALGGTAVVTSLVTKFWSGQPGGVRVGLTLGVAAIVVATIIAVSVMVAADVRGRAQGTVALYAARASIADQFLRQSLQASRPVPPAPAPQNPGMPAPAPAPAPQNPAIPAPAPQNGALPKSVPIYLAASGARARVLHKPSNQSAHLAGLRQLDDGATQVLLIREVDGQTDWCAPEDITVLEFSY
jgi:hypothetical protein